MSSKLARSLVVLAVTTALAGLAVFWLRAKTPATASSRSIATLPATHESRATQARSAPTESALPSENVNSPAVSSAPTHERAELPPTLLAACGEWDPALRAQRIEAALRTWAEQDAEAAAAWANSQSFLARPVALAAVVNGAAAGDPRGAENLVAALAAAEPANADEYRGFLIFALGESGAHARAAEWAATGTEPKPEFFATAYGRWAKSDPSAAWAAADAVPDDYRRHIATRAALNAWAKAQPAQLADFAAGLADGPEKSFALVAALRAWTSREPERAAAWMLAHGDSFTGVPRVETILED